MTNDEQDEPDQQSWRKRFKWSQSDLPALDEQINELASLWADGVLLPRELLPEVVTALRASTVRPETPRTSDALESYANNIRVAAQWMAFMQVIHFCDQHEWNSTPEKVDALRLFMNKLGETGPAVGGVNSWIANACEFRSQTEEADDPMHQLVRRWVEGTGVRDHEDLIEQSIAVRKPLHDERRPGVELPEFAVDRWIDALRADVQGLVLRETDAYCRAARIDSPAERAQAWHQLQEGLKQPPRGRSL